MGACGARGGGAGRWLGALHPAVACAALALARAAGGQVTLDGSLGPAGPVPFDGTTWHVTDDLGTRSGANLFHSFSLLDVPAGQTASFHLLDPTSPEPDFVIARVTGGDPSTIDGRIQSLHQGASLFLLNPSGFSFGPQSALEALGSVYLSTADVLRFGGDAPFDARSAAPPALLSSDPPTAFGFLSAQPAPIAFDLDAVDTGFDSLPVPRGATLAAVAGQVRIDGASASPGSVPTIRIEGGSVELAAVAAAGVDVPVDVASFDARAQAPGTLGEVALGRNALVDVGSPLGAPVGSGRVVVRAGRLVVDDARIDVVAGSDVPGRPIAVDLEAAEALELRAGSRLTLRSAGAAAGDLRLSAESVHLGEGSLVFVRSSLPAGGSAGRLSIDAETARIDGAANVLHRSEGAVTGGEIELDVGSLALEGGGQILSEALGSGGGAAIDVTADSLAIRSGGQLVARSAAPGAGGSIRVRADSATVGGPSQIRSLSTGSGPGGAIELDAGELRVDAQGQIVSENSGAGAGGAIDARVAREVEVASRGKILSQATGAASAPGGDVRVVAGERILVVGQDSTDADASQISALTSSTSAGGSGGGLRVSAPTIELRDAGQLRTTTSGAAQGGALDVEGTGLLRVVGNATIDGELSGAGLFARSDPAPGFVGQPGNGGDLTIAARVVEVEDGGEISTRTFAAGDAGDLRVTGAERLAVRGGPRGVSLLSSKGASGRGGNVLIVDAGEVELASRGQVSASTLGTGDAGRISVSAERISISGDESGLFSQTTFAGSDSGAAGDIEVAVADRLEVRDGGRISVDSLGGGPAGDVAISGGSRASVVLVGGSVSAKSFRSAEAGNVAIETGRDFVAGRGALVRTEAEDNASGGRITLAAGRIFYASDSQLDTQVTRGLAGGQGDGGDVDAPGTSAPPPSLAVLNRSAIVAKTGDGKGGNIRVAADDLLASQGVVIDATSERGVPGEVQITSPDATLAGQITPLPSNFFDASRLMTTPCDARRARTGSFVVQTRKAVAPPPDAPLSASDLGAAGAAGPEAGSCPDADASGAPKG